jgi:adenylate kinase family enzyme
MQKINVVGCPGAGKSTLARQISKQTGLPIIHLDKTYHDASHPYADPSVWNAHIDDFVNRPAWIIDGVHQTTYERRFKNADLTVFLDFPLRICLWRVVLRWYKNRGTQRPDMPQGWREHLGINFILFVLTYRHKERPAVYRALQAYAEKTSVYVAKTPKDVEALLTRFDSDSKEAPALSNPALKPTKP